MKGYATLLVVYGAGVIGFCAWFKKSGRELPDRVAPGDLALVTVASQTSARLITKARVLRPLRVPFSELDGNAGPAEVSEHPRELGGGLRHAIGDLLVCPFCLGMWTTSTLIGSLLVWPRATRWFASLLTSYFGTELLHVGYKRVQKLL